MVYLATYDVEVDMKFKLLLLSLFFSGAVLASSDKGSESVDGEEMHDQMHEQADCVEGDENCETPGIIHSDEGEVIHHDGDVEMPLEDHMGDH